MTGPFTLVYTFVLLSALGLRSVFSDQGRELPHGGVGYTGGVRKDVSSAELPSHFFDGGVEGIKRTK